MWITISKYAEIEVKNVDNSPKKRLYRQKKWKNPHFHMFIIM